MRTLAFVFIALFLAAPANAERRCGWYNNPSPANVFLKDADGFWWIAKQGSPPAPGSNDAYTPAFDDRVRLDAAGKIVTNGGSYGYSCACADGVFGPVGSGEVLSITRLDALPIAQCENDPNLPDSPYFGE